MALDVSQSMERKGSTLLLDKMAPSRGIRTVGLLFPPLHSRKSNVRITSSLIHGGGFKAYGNRTYEVRRFTISESAKQEKIHHYMIIIYVNLPAKHLSGPPVSKLINLPIERFSEA